MGINTLMPSTHLHVNGSAFVSDTLTTNRLVVNEHVTGLAASATTDTTVASNITRGLLLPSVIPATGVTAGSYGSSRACASFVVEADGRMTSATPCPIRLQASNVNGLALSATMDTTQASNITAGTLSSNRFPDTGVVTPTYHPEDVSILTVQSDGRISSITTRAISIQGSQIEGLQPGATTDRNQPHNTPSVVYGLQVSQNLTQAASAPVLTVTGGAAVSDGLTVHGTLGVQSSASFTSQVAMNGGAIVNGPATVVGGVSVANLVGPLQVDSTVMFTGPVAMAGGATLSQLTVTGQANVVGNLSVGNLVGSCETAGNSGTITFSSNATFAGQVAMTGGATMTSMAVTNQATLRDLSVGNWVGPMVIGSNATFTSNVIVSSNLTVVALAVTESTTASNLGGGLLVEGVVKTSVLKTATTFTNPVTLAGLSVGSDATFSAAVQATSGLTTLSSLTVTQSTLLASTSNTGSLFVGGGFQVQQPAQLSGGISAPSLSGGCITDSTTTTSSQVAASATAVQGVAAIASAALARSGGSMTGPLFSSNLSSCNVFAAALTGGAITDSWTTTSSQVAASATAVSNVAAQISPILLRTGGILTGPLTVQGLLTASNVQILGTTTTINSHEILTSNLWVANMGTGPALSVSQVEGGTLGSQPVATFYSGQSLALLLDGSGNVALGKPSVTSGATLDVSGNVVVSGTLTAGTIIGNATGLMGTPSISVGAIAASGTSSFMGPVGVGKAASLVPLDVNGSIAVSGQASFASNLSVAGQLMTNNFTCLFGTLTYASATLGNITVPSNGSMGVGTTAAQGFALDVSGSVNVRGSVTIGNYVYSSDQVSGAYMNTISKKLNRLFAGWAFDEEGGICTPIGRQRVTFSCTGSDQTWTAPATGYMYVKMWGAGGAGGNVGGWSSPGPGGAGGHSRGLIPVTAGVRYTIVVGVGGQTNYPGSTTPSYGGGGGFQINNDNRYGGQGGGFCGMFAGAVTQANAILIAGGGGGGSCSASVSAAGNWGGAGGGLSGEQGNSPTDALSYGAGGPGTQTTGGTSWNSMTTTQTSTGSALLGGFSGNTLNTNSYGGGGGGGFFGGGAGTIVSVANSTMGGGGGGSGFVASNVIFGATFTGSQQQPPFTWDPDLPPVIDPFCNSSKYAHGGEAAFITSQYTGAFGGCGCFAMYY